jgi:hypothetical protein
VGGIAATKRATTVGAACTTLNVTEIDENASTSSHGEAGYDDEAIDD